MTDPVVAGRLTIWTRWPAHSPVSIDGIDLHSGRRLRVATLPADHYNPQFGPDKTMLGDLVVWVQSRNATTHWPPHYHLVAEDLASRRLFHVVPGQNGESQPAVSGNRLVYIDDRSAHSDSSRALVLETRLPSGRQAADPIWPILYRGGD